MTNACGSCALCCKLLPIDEPALKKPGGRWCGQFKAGSGCKVYADRPAACRAFMCHWRHSQDTATPLAPALRPDRCKVMFSSPDGAPNVMAHTTPEGRDAFRDEEVARYLLAIVKSGQRVVWGWDFGTDKYVFHYHAGAVARARVKMSLPDAHGRQHEI